MICKSCGTECKGQVCSHCGEKMTPDTVATPSPTAVSSEPVKKARRPVLSVKMVLWQSIALLLPLAYLFFDTFILLYDALFYYSASGSMHLHRFMERLTGLSYETNTVGEIMELTMGESITVFKTVSPMLWRSAELDSAFFLPVILLVLFVLLSAAAGVLLLLTGGRILRMRSFVNLTLIAGTGATFAPLLGMLILRLRYSFDGGFAAADLQMQHIVLSLEAICVMGILICALLPSLASLRRTAAYAQKEREFVCFPYRFLTKSSFKCSKIVAILSMVVFLALTVCFFALPITTTAQRGVDDVIRGIGGDWNAAVSVVKSLFAKDGGLSVVEGAGALINLACDIWMLLVLIGALCAVLGLLRVLFVKKEVLLKKKSKQRALKKYAKAILDASFAPCVIFIVLQVLLCIAFMFFTPIAMHLNFSNVNDTLSIVYLTMAYVRTLCATNTLYAILCLGGLLLWHMADQTTAALIVQADKEKSA
ncbi:MAG: hypothetical protein IJY43_04775 [Clostridia bacterium]|nr:hypothetical protein [Clostridia bacterium]